MSCAILVLSSAPAAASVIGSGYAETVLSIAAISAGTPSAYEILGGVSISDAISQSTSGATSALFLDGHVGGTFIGNATALGFGAGFIDGDVYRMDVGDTLSFGVGADAQSSASGSFADALLNVNGVISITNLSTTSILSAAFTWSAFLDTQVAAAFPTFADAIATADLGFRQALLPPGGTDLLEEGPVFNPLSATSDLIFGPLQDGFGGSADFFVDLDPGYTQYFFLTADASATTALLVAPVPIPPSSVSLLFGFASIFALSRRRRPGRA